MKKIVFVIAAVLNFSVYAATPLSHVPTKNKPSVVVVDAKSNVVTVRLKSNRTTGYSWFLSTYDTHFLVPASYRYEEPAVGMMGASGTSVWTFKQLPVAKAVPSVTTVTWVYVRPWEKSENAKKHSVTIYFTN